MDCLRKKLFFRLFLWALSVLFIENTICSMASCMEYDEYLFEKDSNEIFSLIDNKKYKEANEKALTACDNAEKSFGKESHNTAIAMSNLAITLMLTNNYEESKELLLSLVEIQKKDSSVGYAGNLIDLAVIYEIEGNTGKADQLYNEAVNIIKSTYGSRYISKLLTCYIQEYEEFEIDVDMKRLKEEIKKYE